MLRLDGVHVHIGKLHILHRALGSDVRRLWRRLRRIAGADAMRGDRRRELGMAIVHLIAALPVYRTYMDGRAPEPHPDDRAVLERALARAQSRGDARAGVLAWLADLLMHPQAQRTAKGGRAEDRLTFVLSPPPP